MSEHDSGSDTAGSSSDVVTDTESKESIAIDSEHDLRRLTVDGRRLVDEPFLRGERSRLAESEVEKDLEPVDATADLAGLRRDLESVMDSFDQHDADMDAATAPIVHRRLDTSRRVAGDPGVWHYLTVVEFPDFVRHRWEYTTENAMREKFLGAGTDLYSNALHRLWWIAELTYDETATGDDRYELTRNVLGRQTLVNRVFDRNFAQYRPAAIAASEELLDASEETIDRVTLRFNRALTTFQLEGLSRDQIHDLLQQIRADVVTD